MSKRPVTEDMPQLVPGPFPRPVDVHAVPDGGLDMAIEATAEERAAIAAEIGLAGLDALTARFHIQPRAGGRFEVEGSLEASIAQVCVVSLEPFNSTITREIDLEFAPPPRSVEVPALPARSRRREPAPREAPPPRPVVVPGNDDQEDPADPIVDGKIDLGAVTLEFLTLSLDLYPRKPGVHFTDVSVGDKDKAGESPFAALRRLKDPS